MQQIKNRYSEEVIHEHGETIAECVQHAREIGRNLTEANLTRANLARADLTRTNLAWANIENTSFKHADMRFCGRDDNAKLAHLNVCEWPVSIQFDGIHIGCKTFTLDKIMNMTEEIAATYSDKAPIRWRRWGKAIQALAKATLEG